MKIVRTHNIKGVLIGTDDEGMFDGNEEKTQAFVDNFEYEFDESVDVEVLCSCINERGSGLKLCKEPFTKDIVVMKDRKTLSAQFMKIAKYQRCSNWYQW
ncbi:hypothetical protein Ddye_011793 [Dipteronia dyeriana]|uniref:Uncharacterized protein n=1 Tax=Dipteronia dyeriana TaxID=168575 RepID=A0AAD9X3A8_9ROSI|nr:hypothetical protein Ddye_011793 [Dipteronia dyeriana]